MKNLFLICVLASLSLLQSCGPAAEDRNYMHQRAKVFQDSIANAIRVQMAEAEGPSLSGPLVTDTNAKKTNTPPAPAGK